MRRMGMTEAFWKTKNEDWRFYWKLTAQAVAMIASFFVAETGMDFLDKVMIIFTAVLPMLITESQRSYTSFSLKLGKRIIKVCTFLSTYGIALIGLLIFSQVLLHSLAKTYLETVSPLVLNGGNGYVVLIMLLSLLWTGVTVTRKSFNDLQVWKIIYHLPKRGMIQLLAARRYPAKTREAFAIFELSVIFFSFMYVSIFRSTIEPFLTLICYAFRATRSMSLAADARPRFGFPRRASRREFHPRHDNAIPERNTGEYCLAKADGPVA